MHQGLGGVAEEDRRGGNPTSSGELEDWSYGAHKRREAAAAIRSRCRFGLDAAAASVFLAQPLTAVLLPGGYRLPDVVLRAAAIIGILLLARRILTFRRWRDEHAQVTRFLCCFLLMMAELTVENCVVWLVSAWDQRKYDTVPGLQDNVGLAVQALAERSSWVRWATKAPAATVLHFLGALLTLAFSVLWDQVPYSGFGVMARVVMTIACSRVLRMACFMCTVLPNPRPGCYQRRFPPVPQGLWATIKAGYTTIRGFGGCNDLIFSGHGAFWVLAPLAFRTYYPGHRLSTWVLWVALLHSSVRDVVDRQHYSVDMLLAVVVTWAVWDWLEWVYPPEAPVPVRPRGSPPDKLNIFVVGLIVACLGVAGVIVIGGKA